MRIFLIIMSLFIATPSLANSSFMTKYESTVLHATYFDALVGFEDHCKAAERALSIRGDVESHIIFAEANGYLFLSGTEYPLEANDVVWLKMQLSKWSTAFEEQKLQCK